MQAVLPRWLFNPVQGLSERVRRSLDRPPAAR